MLSGKSEFSKKDWASVARSSSTAVLGWRRGLEGVQVMKGLVSKRADDILFLLGTCGIE
jgi:hypothetical protein